MIRSNYVIRRWLSLAAALCRAPAAPLGVFEDNADVGTVLHAGSVEYDSAKRTYTVAGSGENMWFAATLSNLFGRRSPVMSP